MQQKKACKKVKIPDYLGTSTIAFLCLEQWAAKIWQGQFPPSVSRSHCLPISHSGSHYNTISTLPLKRGQLISKIHLLAVIQHLESSHE